MFKKLACLICVMFVSACASNVYMGDKSGSYAYNGERYGKINVVLAEAVASDADKVVRANQINLESKIKAYLLSNGAFDESSPNKIDVVVNKLHVRNAFNAIMFGFMSGSDSLDGTVILKDDSDVQKATFDISASYALGGFGGGQNDARLGWLGDKFAELTANTVVGKK